MSDCFTNIILATYNFCLQFFLLLKFWCSYWILVQTLSQIIPLSPDIICLQMSFLYDLIMHLNGDFELGVDIPDAANSYKRKDCKYSSFQNFGWAQSFSHFNVIGLQVMNLKFLQETWLCRSALTSILFGFLFLILIFSL